MQPYQPCARLAASLSAADVHLISPSPALEGFIVLSKFYGIAAGRPTLCADDPDGEIPRILREAACGWAVPVDDSEGPAAAIRQLRDDVARLDTAALISHRFPFGQSTQAYELLADFDLHS